MYGIIIIIIFLYIYSNKIILNYFRFIYSSAIIKKFNNQKYSYNKDYFANPHNNYKTYIYSMSKNSFIFNNMIGNRTVYKLTITSFIHLNILHIYINKEIRNTNIIYVYKDKNYLTVALNKYLIKNFLPPKEVYRSSGLYINKANYRIIRKCEFQLLTTYII